MALESLGFEQVTVAGSSTALDPDTATTSAKGVVLAVCVLEGAQVRYRADGTAPTASVGTPLEVGEELKITGDDDIRDIRFIRTGGTSGTLNVEYFGTPA